MVSKWYVLRTEPRAEHQSAEALVRSGYEIFFPKVNRPDQRPESGRTPLFPGYLFIKIDGDAEFWPTFRPDHRVSRWLSFGDVIPSIPDEVVDDLRQRVDALNGDHGLWRKYRVGETVRVVSETLESLAKVVEEAKSPQAKALVLMQFMGRMVPTRVPWANLQPVEGQQQEKLRIPRRTRGRGRWVRGQHPSAASNAIP